MLTKEHPERLSEIKALSFGGIKGSYRKKLLSDLPLCNRSLPNRRFTLNLKHLVPHTLVVCGKGNYSIKTMLYVTVGTQPVVEDVLRNLLIELEGVLNSKGSGYVSSSVSYLDPETPRHLLMG